MNRIEKIEQQIAELQAEKEELEQKDFPKDGDIYHYLSRDFSVCVDGYREDCHIDTGASAYGNCFRCSDDAQRYRESMIGFSLVINGFMEMGLDRLNKVYVRGVNLDLRLLKALQELGKEKIEEVEGE